MKDTDIIKALEFESTPMERNCVHATYKEDCLGFYCTKTGKLAENCMECKEHTMDWRGRHSKATLDLINRQQAEIERLNKEIEEYPFKCKVGNNSEIHSKSIQDYDNLINDISAEAIKELEAKIHEKLHQAEMHGNFEPVVTREMFDSVVKEMVGEGK